jgi:hypothetical protein
MSMFLLRLLPHVARLHPKNWRPDRWRYPQLWYCGPKRWKRNKRGVILRKARPRLFLEWLCGAMTGHELSKTEWGYGGGKFIDRNCRWCDKFVQVPKDEEPTKRDRLLDIYLSHGEGEEWNTNPST